MTTSNPEIPAIFKRKIEAALERNISLNDCDSVFDLNLINNIYIDDVKRIAEKQDEFVAERYLKYLTTPDNHPFLMDFFGDVILDNKPAKTWRKSVAIYLEVSSVTIKKNDNLSDLISPLRNLSDEFNITRLEQIPINYDAWRSRVKAAGSPCLVIKNFDYKKTLTHPLQITCLEDVEIHELKNPSLLIARKLCSTIAWSVKDHLTKENLDPELIREKYIKLAKLGSLTPLMELAFNILEQEHRILHGTYGNEVVPGYQIDDENLSELINTHQLF